MRKFWIFAFVVAELVYETRRIFKDAARLYDEGVPK